MAINQNHLFDELDGIKCAIVEKNVKPARVAFLKDLLELNHYIVVVVASPPPKVATAPAPKPVVVEGEYSPANVTTVPQPAPGPLAETFTVGVTDVTFNAINAVFGRLLQTKDGHIVTLAYWQQKDSISLDDIPYFDK